MRPKPSSAGPRRSANTAIAATAATRSAKAMSQGALAATETASAVARFHASATRPGPKSASARPDSVQAVDLMGEC
jgi:hypothetical protein